jgi:hypothetical protein
MYTIRGRDRCSFFENLKVQCVLSDANTSSLLRTSQKPARGSTPES